MSRGNYNINGRGEKLGEDQLHSMRNKRYVSTEDCRPGSILSTPQTTWNLALPVKHIYSGATLPAGIRRPPSLAHPLFHPPPPAAKLCETCTVSARPRHTRDERRSIKRQTLKGLFSSLPCSVSVFSPPEQNDCEPTGLVRNVRIVGMQQICTAGERGV